MKQSRKKKNLNQLFCEEVAKLIKKDSKLILEDDLENGLRGDLSDKNLSPAEADFENQLQSEVDNIDTDEYNQEEKKLQAHIKQRTEENNELLAEWVRRVNEFIDFINADQKYRIQELTDLYNEFNNSNLSTISVSKLAYIRQHFNKKREANPRTCKREFMYKLKD